MEEVAEDGLIAIRDVDFQNSRMTNRESFIFRRILRQMKKKFSIPASHLD